MDYVLVRSNGERLARNVHRGLAEILLTIEQTAMKVTLKMLHLTGCELNERS